MTPNNKVDVLTQLSIDVVDSIAMRTKQVGGDPVDALITLQNVIVGMVIKTTKPGCDEYILGKLLSGASKSLAEYRLGKTKTAGEA